MEADRENAYTLLSLAVADFYRFQIFSHVYPDRTLEIHFA
jgi:hypothetical protein